MQQYKIDDFVKDHPHDPFPDFEEVSREATDDFRRKVAKLVGVENKLPLELVNALDKAAKVVPGFNAHDDDFNLENVFKAVGVWVPKQIYVNWYRFDEIDRLGFADLKKYFWDFWYPGADDIDLFDSNVEWILSITHDGLIKILSSANGGSI